MHWKPNIRLHKKKQKLQSKKLNSATIIKNKTGANQIINCHYFVFNFICRFVFPVFVFETTTKINKIITIEQKKLELTQAIIDGEEQERTRLAKELHDGIGGLIC